MKILITVPPMIQNLSNYKLLFKKYSFDVTAPKIKQILPIKKLEKILENYDGWIAGDDKINFEVLKKAKNKKLKAIVKWGTGIDNFNTDDLKKIKLKFANTPNVFGDEVSNLAITYFLNFATSAFQISDEVKVGNWKKVTNINLRNSTVGIVGYGDVGKSIFKKIKMFTQNAIIWDDHLRSKRYKKLLTKWPNKIEKCDFIIVCCSLNKDNHDLISKSILKKCKKNFYLINVSRGDLVNEISVVDYLKKGRILGFASDVFKSEPLPSMHYFKKSYKCVLGSHNASNVEGKIDYVSTEALKKMKFFLKND